MPKLFSYVVDHDCGIAPDPADDYCTLAKCKFKGRGGRRNIAELAREGDWIVGTGGVKKVSAGHGKIVYAMRVDEKLPLARYYEDKRFKGRKDNTATGEHQEDRFVLISQHFYYFGRNAIDIEEVPKKHLKHSLEKTGPGFRADFDEEFIKDFVKWLERKYDVGVHGEPCGYNGESRIQIRKVTQYKC
jgi:hypothetical protein